MLKISYSSLVYYWHLLFMYIYDSNPLECFPPMKCCLTGRGTEFGRAHCSHNISASDPIGMNAMQQKAAIDCLTTCLKDPQCQTYEYNSDNSCWLGFKSYQDCFSYLRTNNSMIAGRNLALGQPATQSSTYIDCEASRVVDGNYNTDGYDGFCSNTNDGPGGPNWLMVDLERIYPVQYVVVTNRVAAGGDGSNYRMNYFIVGVTNISSATQAPVRGAYPLCGQYPYTAPEGANMTVNCAANTPPARFVIIQQPANGAGWMNLCELQVYSSCK